MNSMNAKNESAIDCMNTILADFKIETAKCDKATIQWTAGLVFGATVLIIAVLGILIRWPVPSV